MELKERLLSKVNTTDPDKCWEWQGTIRSKKTGYGSLKVDGKIKSTHRLSYKEFKGEFDESLFVCHTCDNRKCINPDHLFLGTHVDNMRDCYEKGRMFIPEGRKFPDKYEPPNKSLTNEQANAIKKAIAEYYPSITLKDLASKLEVPYQLLRDIRRKKAKCYK